MCSVAAQPIARPQPRARLPHAGAHSACPLAVAQSGAGTSSQAVAVPGSNRITQPPSGPCTSAIVVAGAVPIATPRRFAAASFLSIAYAKPHHHFAPPKFDPQLRHDPRILQHEQLHGDGNATA